jgi:hypothetical protein
MRDISIRKLRNHLAQELQDLPFNITKYGTVIACVHNKQEIKQDKPSSVHNEPVKLCPHGVQPVLCRHTKCHRT